MSARQPLSHLLLPLALSAATTAACGNAAPATHHDHEHQQAVQHEHGSEHTTHGEHGHDDGHVGHVGTRVEESSIHVTHDEQQGALILEIRPIPLPAAHGPDQHVMPVTPLLEASMPFDATFTAFRVELLDGTGRPMPQEVLHHVNVMLPDRRDLFRPIMQRLVAAGEETDEIALPWPLGFSIAEGETLLAYAMLHNDGHTDYGDVTLRLHFDYTRSARRVAVQPIFLDVSPPPGPASWDLPPGRSVRTWEGSPAVSGRVLGLGGHLHRYGTALILEDVTAGKVLFRTEPELDDDGNVVAMPQRQFLTRLGLRLRADHVYRITAIYDNPTGRTIPDGAMGALGGVIRVGGDWPDAEPQHPLWERDRRILQGTLSLHAAGP